jgi:two-component system, LytTR family, sensor kinase
MSPASVGSSPRIATIALVAAAFLALSVSFQIYLAMADHGHAFWRLVAWQGVAWGFWAAATPALCRMCETWGDGAPNGRQIARIAIAGTVLVAGHLLVSAVIVFWLQPYVPIQRYTVGEALEMMFKSQIIADLLVYTLVLLAGRSIAVGRRARQLAVREAQLEGDVARARLEALRLEIQPHFLFNTLNSIAALIRIRANDQALKMLLGLGALMRATIDRTPSQVTTWPIELDFTKGYIELQQVRFGDRLDVAYAIDPAAEACLVPAFLLQPIVENAFRHGIGAKAGRCRLELGAAMIGGRLRVTVRDDGAGVPAGFDLARDAGTGLSNVRTRLQNLYGGPASVSVAAVPGGGTLVTLDLPPEPPADLARASA